MWTSAAWTAVIFAYVAVVVCGVLCECFRVKRARAKRAAQAEPHKYDDIIGFR